MREWYEVWNTAVGNMIGAFATEHEALAEVRGLIEVNGADYVDHLALARRRTDGGDPIASGAELAKLAAEPRPARRTA